MSRTARRYIDLSAAGTPMNDLLICLTLEACERLNNAEKARMSAHLDRDLYWHTDRPGRRERGGRLGRATAASNSAMKVLIVCVQAPKAHPAVVEHFRVCGPTYYEAARAVDVLRRKLVVV